MEERFQAALAALDMAAIERDFKAADEFVFIERFLPPDLVADLAAEAKSFLERGVHRAWIPWVRRAGAVGQADIAAHAPLLHALARSKAVLEFARRLSGQDLHWKSANDAHAAALYYYQRKGDHVGWHVDECGCGANFSYTANLGITNDTKSRVVFRLNGAEREVAMVPGSLAFFCGSKPYHRVLPLDAGEERIAYSFTFVREGRRMGKWQRFNYNVWDALAYFGPKAIFQKNYD